MGKLTKKEGACPKREMDTDRLQSLLIDYEGSQKVRHGLQSLQIEHKKRLQKSELDYKV